MPCLLEVNIGQEESKSGFSPEGVLDAAGEIAALPNLSLRGLMTVAPAYLLWYNIIINFDLGAVLHE